MRTILSKSDRIIYEAKAEFVIGKFREFGLSQKEFTIRVNQAGYKLDPSDLSKLFTGKKKVTLRWLPILDFAVEYVNSEQQKYEKAVAELKELKLKRDEYE